MTQFLMALFGLSAMAAALSNNDTARRLAPMLGLLGHKERATQ